MKVYFISNGYPFENEPEYTFVKNLVDEISNQGVECTVISPQSISKQILNRKKRRPIFWTYKTNLGGDIKVYQPYYFSLSNLKVNGMCLSNLFFMKAVKKVYKTLEKPDIIYGHFWECGVVGAYILDENIPVIVASGESKIKLREKYPDFIIKKAIEKIKGVIFVSTKNKNESIKLGLIKSWMQTEIIPNAINPNEFYVMNKVNERKKLGFDTNIKIGIFVGSFNDRKGIKRVEEATKSIPNLEMIYIGSGEQIPEKYIFFGSVEHDKLVHYLNVADFFVLPTLAEGCCNAIIEAMGCGLPIISSDLDFNYDILDKDSALLVDPNNINEIRSSVKIILRDKEISDKLVEKSLLKVKDLTIERRAKKIINFLKKVQKIGE